MALPAGIPPRPVTRFAPSPTGELHLGHVANAVWTWGIAQAAGGTVVLRIEDHDRGRSRPAFEAAIRRDLAWLGLEAEPGSAGSLAAGGRSRYRQSDNDDRYQAALEALRRVASVYWCECSRKEIAAAVPVAGSDGERRYPGTCREKGLGPGPHRSLRVVLPDAAVTWVDARLGPIAQNPARQCGDLLLKDGVGNWTYQFSVVVDDLDQGIGLVVRGEDILPSTARQIELGAMLGRAAPPVFLHHPLILGEAGAKLSKRDGAAGLDRYRADGLGPADLLGRAAWATGLLPAPAPVEPDRLGELFG